MQVQLEVFEIALPLIFKVFHNLLLNPCTLLCMFPSVALLSIFLYSVFKVQEENTLCTLKIEQ